MTWCLFLRFCVSQEIIVSGRGNMMMSLSSEMLFRVCRNLNWKLFVKIRHHDED